MNSTQVRKKYLDFFTKKGHKVIPSANLVPENDPTTLFTGSGMQPLIPFLLGEPHPEGKRLVNSQKSFRSQDIEEVGDNRHTTFFEMLGNWSLGDPAHNASHSDAGGYFKKDQLTWLWQFLTQKLNLSPDRLYVSVFEGDSNVPKDEESIKVWKELGVQDDHIYFYGVHKNWWSRSGIPENMPEGEIGGPDSEVFFEFTNLKHDSKYGSECHPNCDCGRFLEIGNSVFIQYRKVNGKLVELPQKNVDFGGGLERLTAATNNQPDIFKNDLHWGIIEKLEEKLGLDYDMDEKTRAAMRIIADHIKAATFLVKDGVLPSNKLQGYVLRRLLRAAAVKINFLKENSMDILPKLVDPVLDIYQDSGYFQTGDWDSIRQVLEEEINKFKQTLQKGLKEIQKIEIIDAKKAFDLYQTYGFPFEITAEIFREKGQSINLKEFEKEFEAHRDLSRTTSAGVFKGGLADGSEKTTRLHTANHLLQAALRQILGTHVRQKGSNITAERLRFDFTHPEKLTEDQLKKAERLVNQKIKEDLSVWFDIEDKEEAIKEGALTNLGETYPDKVKVYKIGRRGGDKRGAPSSARTLSDQRESKGRTSDGAVSRQDPESMFFSAELCGGPHVEHTSQLKSFKILKEESAGSGIRRIYATIEN